LKEWSKLTEQLKSNKVNKTKVVFVELEAFSKGNANRWTPEKQTE
jgi:hypothetical protein